MNIDIYDYKRVLREELIRQWQNLEISDQPLDWLWIYSALLADSLPQSSLITGNILKLITWCENPDIIQPKNLGALGLVCNLLYQLETGDPDSLASKVVNFAYDLIHKQSAKFSALNDPIIFYGVTLVGRRYFNDQQKSDFEAYCVAQISTGNIRRLLFYSASLCELGFSPSSLTIQVSKISPDELPTLLWFGYKYPNILNLPSLELWNLLSEFKEQIIIEQTGLHVEGNFFNPNAIDLSMLFIAVAGYAGKMDPVALYKILPLHSKVRLSSESLFMKGEYLNAVFEASKTFVNEVKLKAGNPVGSNGKPLDGRSLIQSVFNYQNPILKFTPLTSQSDRDEHEGLKLISEGIIAAIRNPKGHDPKDSLIFSVEEALDQLVVISYMLKRIERI